MSTDFFKTKKLLFLGAAEFQVPAIKTAQRLGCQVIVTDNVPTNIGHRIGNFSENISTIDFDGLVEIAKKYKVDGVMTYGSDVSSPGVSYVAEKLGLPGNPLKSAQILQRKDEFRLFQQKAGLPHPRFQIINKEYNVKQDIFSLAFPVVVKPVDSSGTKGQSVISSLQSLETALEEAKRFSRSGVVICEEFVKSDMLELDGDILIQNGKLAFGHYGHNYF